jgi:hypothetical protein
VKKKFKKRVDVAATDVMLLKKELTVGVRFVSLCVHFVSMCVRVEEKC